MKIIDLSKHELVLATGLQARHYVSGHTFELLEYWWYFRQHGVDAAIMCTAHKPDILFKLAAERYIFTDEELKDLHARCYDATEVLIAKLPTVLWVDGCSKYQKHATVVAKRQIAFACNNTDEFSTMDLVLGDTRLYDNALIDEHYVKKLLLGKFKPVETTVQDTAMLYCTIQARKLQPGYLDSLPQKYPHIKKFLVVTNDAELETHDQFDVVAHPCPGLFSKFNTYIYSPLKIQWQGAIKGVSDCSPRFPAECTHYNKEVIIDAPVSKGLNVRLYDCQDLSKITLDINDLLIQMIF